MLLTQEDLEKIKALIDARADLQDMKFERRFEEIRNKMATKEDLRQLREEVATKEQLEQVKTMLEEDHGAVVHDIELLKAQVAELQAK